MTLEDNSMSLGMALLPNEDRLRAVLGTARAAMERPEHKMDFSGVEKIMEVAGKAGIDDAVFKDLVKSVVREAYQHGSWNGSRIVYRMLMRTVGDLG